MRRTSQPTPTPLARKAVADYLGTLRMSENRKSRYNNRRTQDSQNTTTKLKKYQETK